MLTFTEIGKWQNWKLYRVFNQLSSRTSYHVSFAFDHFSDQSGTKLEDHGNWSKVE